MAWEEEARCRKHDPDIFFAVGARAERRAKSICARCPVRSECLAYAVESGAEFGIWGGLNGRELAVVRRRLGGAGRRTPLRGTRSRAPDLDLAGGPVR